MQAQANNTSQEPGIGKNTAIGIATNVAAIAMGLLISVVLTRGVGGADQRGVYSALVITNGLLATLLNLSMSASFSTLLARGRFRLGEVNIVAILLSASTSVACLVLSLLLFPLVSGNLFHGIPFDYLVVAAVLVGPMVYQVYWSSMMMGLNRIILLNKVNFALNVSNTALMILFVGVLPWGIQGFLIGWVLNAFVGAIVSLVISARIDGISWPPSRKAFKEMIGFGLRAHGATVAYQLFLRFDAYAVKIILGNAALGYYSLSTSLTEKLWILPNAVGPSSISKISQLPHHESALLTAKIARVSLLLMTSVAIPFAAITPWLVPFLYGAEYSASVIPLMILLLGTLGFAGMMVLNNYVLGQMGRPGLLSVISWLELAVSVPLYLLFINWLGIVGAAIASSLIYLLTMSGAMAVFIKDSGLSAIQVLLPRSEDFRDYKRVMYSIMRRPSS